MLLVIIYGSVMHVLTERRCKTIKDITREHLRYLDANGVLAKL